MDDGFKQFLQYVLEVAGRMERMTHELQDCPACGTTYHRFRSSGKLGCAACYDAFRDSITAALTNIHGNADYMGKIPRGQAHEYADLLIKRELDEVQKKLRRALEKEDFSAAAKYRDIISELMEKITPKSDSEGVSDDEMV